MTDERKPSEEGSGDPEERDPKLDREDVKDLTPGEEDTEDVRGGARCGGCGGLQSVSAGD